MYHVTVDGESVTKRNATIGRAAGSADSSTRRGRSWICANKLWKFVIDGIICTSTVNNEWRFVKLREKESRLKNFRLYCNLDTSRATQGDYSFTYNYLSAESDSSPSVARRGVAWVLRELTIRGSGDRFNRRATSVAMTTMVSMITNARAANEDSSTPSTSSAIVSWTRSRVKRESNGRHLVHDALL